MPEAIATTKRRFYKALDGFSSQTSLQHPSSTAASAASSTTKRSSAAAFDDARERVRKRLRQSTSSTSLNSRDQALSVISLPRKTTTGKTADTPSKPPPHFSPWSQETFLARLKTFSNVSLWHPKPDSINEVEWAKRGWVCVDVNTVACRGGCEKRVVVSLPTSNTSSKEIGNQEDENNDDEDEDQRAGLEQALAERYKSVIVDGHSSSCLWHRAGCKDDIYRLPVVRPSVWQSELRKRFNSLLAIDASITNVKTRPLDKSTSKLLKELPNDILGITPPPNDSQSKAFEIAMHGWRGSLESGNHLLHCDACFQRVGLWMYQPEYAASRAKHSSKSEDEEDPVLIDLVEMHRDHCPWRSSRSQQATGSLEGLNACEVLNRVVSTAARDHRRRSDHHTNVQTEELESETPAPDSPATASREEVARQDKERESRLRKLKNLFNIKRRPTTKAAPQKAT